MRIADMNWMQVESYLRADDRVVLPLGSVEQHAALSLATDALLAERVAVEAAEPLGVPVYPVLAFGVAPYFMAYPGTVTLRPGTYAGVVRDLMDSLAGNVQDAGGTIRDASSALQGTLGRLDSATAGGRLDRIFTDAETSASNLAAVTAEWRDAGRRMTETLDRADSTLAQAGEALGRVNEGEGTLGRLTSDVVLYENTAATLEELRSLLDDLKTNPGKYFHFSVF